MSENQAHFIQNEKSILQRLQSKDWDERNIEVWVKRDDLLHPEVSGNKWRKLYYNIEQAKQYKCDGIFTFGGAFSNHLVATAFAAKESGLKSIGFVRGDELNKDSNHTLRRCSELGMELQFLSREMYVLHNDKQFIDELKLENLGFYAVPEGGANYFGIIGCQAIWKELPSDVDQLFVAQGTTTTSCGLLLGLPEKTKLHVVPVLKGFDVQNTMKNHLSWFLFDENLATELVEKVKIHAEFHFGGYGKVTDELIQFLNSFYSQTAIPLDPVYTGKMVFGVLDLIEKGYFPENSKILMIHTGGLQGIKGMNFALQSKNKEIIQFYEN
jgi:1-aminocyclopropane-1-carboxylate deaminase